MKKLCMLMAVILLFSFAFTSCGMFKPSNPEGLEKRIDKQMSRLSSYRAEEKMTMIFYNSGKRVDAGSTGEIIVSDGRGDDNYYYQRLDTKVVSKGLGLDRATTSILAYNDGNMFSLNTGNQLNQRLYSPMDFDEFVDILEDHTGSELSYSDCGKSKLEQNDDGGWILECSDYSTENINIMTEKLGLDSSVFNLVAKDVNVTVECDDKFRMEKMKMVFVFDESDRKPTVEIETTYSQYNNANRVTDLIDPEDYKKTEHLKLIYDLENKLNEMEIAEEGAFEMGISQKVSRSSQILSSENEKNSVSYGVKDGKFYYDITSEKGKEKYTIAYEDGTQTSTSKTNYVRETPQTEQQAKEYISSLIRASGYSYGVVTNIVKESDRQYKLECQVPVSDYKKMFDSLNVKYSSSTYEMTVLVNKDGEFEKLNSVINIKAKSGSSVFTINISSSLKINLDE